jgi:exopolysaccharide biosynthesis polyprenyl glycosylphosphotransferase
MKTSELPSDKPATQIASRVAADVQPAEALDHARSSAWPRLATNEWRDSLLRRMLASSDIVAVLIGSLSLGFLLGSNVYAFFWSVALAPGWVVTAKLVGLYDRDQRTLRHLTVDETPLLAMWAILGALGVTLFFRLPVPGSFSLTSAAHLMLVTFAAAVLLRSLNRRLWRYVTPPERTVIIGSGPDADAVRRKIALFPDLHLKVVAEIPDVSAAALDDGEEWWRSVDRIVVTSPAVDDLTELAALGQREHIRLSVVPLTRSLFGAAVQLNRVADLTLLEYRTWDVPRSTIFLKRILDLAVSSVGLVLLAPVGVVIALAIKLGDRGPVFFSQIRAGQNGRPFRMHKFRTMNVDAEHRLLEIVPFDSLSEPMFKIHDDPRVTRVGRFLRHWSLDEIPQLLNVLLGQMSLVGPRPEQLDLVKRYRPEHLFRLSVKPGMTGPMQVSGRGVLSFEERLAVERAYIENLSLGSDLRILAMTISAVFNHKGAL